MVHKYWNWCSFTMFLVFFVYLKNKIQYVTKKGTYIWNWCSFTMFLVFFVYLKNKIRFKTYQKMVHIYTGTCAVLTDVSHKRLNLLTYIPVLLLSITTPAYGLKCCFLQVNKCSCIQVNDFSYYCFLVFIH